MKIEKPGVGRPLLGPAKNRQLGLTVLKQRAEQQQISLSFRLEGLKDSEMNGKCKQQHSLSAGAPLLASKLSFQVVYFF